MAVDEFKWGRKKSIGVGRTNKNLQYYESFIYYNVQYFLYDYVYLYNSAEVDAYVGKIVKIFETPNHERKVKVVWLFRPAEIRQYLRDYEPKWNEVFLACGEGNGVTNVTPLDSIIGKCNVVCASRDIRNPQASEEELRMADFIHVHHHCFDVGQCRILKNFVDHVSLKEVEYYFNKRKDQKDSTPAEGRDQQVSRNLKSDSQVAQGAENKKQVANVGVQEHILAGNTMLRPKTPIDSKEADESHVLPAKKRKLLPVENTTLVSQKVCPPVAPEANTICNIGINEKRRWFRQDPQTWLERLKKAEEAGTLVLLENLDPSLTSSEVEDLVWQAFNQIVEAKMIPKNTFSSPYYGKALVLFKSLVAADSAISMLRKRCLVLEDGRPIVGGKGSLSKSGKVVSFNGHLSINQLRQRQRQSEDVRKAVSTSHCSQHNTLEYEMASEWCVLQNWSDLWWNKLFMKQREAIENVKRRLKRNQN